MKNKLFIVLVNIFVFFVLFISIDFILYYFDHPYECTATKECCKSYIDFYQELWSRKSEQDLRELYINGKMKNGFDFYRPIVNRNSDKKPILLFGCSFVYGILVPNNSIFSEVLGRNTQRPIYNRARDGMGSALMLYQLQSEDFYKIIPEPEYIIYTYIFDHIRRVNATCLTQTYYYDLFYKSENNELIRREYFPKIYLFETLKMRTFRYTPVPKDIDLFRKQILEINKLIKQHWKKSKFIIFVYNYNCIDNLQKEFEENGIRVIYRKDIAPFHDFDERYALSKTDSHPNKYAWEYIAPKLMNVLENE